MIFFINTNLKNLELWRNSSLILEEMFRGIRNYSTKPNQAVDLRKLRPMIMKRIQERAEDYPVKPMLPVAREVLQARVALYDGVSTLIHHIPIWACKHCPEVYISEGGHLIRTCHGYQHHARNKVHDWVKGNINDIIIPGETFHHEIIHHQRIPAVLDLCLQAGVDSNDQFISSSVITQNGHENSTTIPNLSSADDLRSVATRTLRAWETLRCGVHKLLLVYPMRVCTRLHVSGHKARTCGVVKYEGWGGTHLWKKARVDDLVPQKIVRYRRRQDPAILVHEGLDYYGRAPAVVDLCSKGGAVVPSKYFSMMKTDGLSFPVGPDGGDLFYLGYR